MSSEHSKIDPELLEGDRIPQGKFVSADKLKEQYQDPGDTDVRGVVFNMFLLVILFVGTFLALAMMMRAYRADQDQGRELALSNRFNADPQPQGPLIQADPADETRAILDEAKARLEVYGWNDEAKTSAHIPIERAMAILAERGLPDVGTVDQFHPKPGSSGVPMIGVPGKPAAPAAAEAKAEEAPAEAPAAAEPKPEAPKSEAK